MSIASPFEERLVEAVGPIVVKEVRQGLRARVFGVAFGVLLLGCLVAALAATAEASGSFSDSLGKRYFALFIGALGVLEFFVIPFTAFRSTVREREDETWVLLALTGLGGRRIVRGKVVSALSQGMLYASACAPFVLFSYYLNGVSIPVLGLALLLTGVWAVFLVCLGVAIGTQPLTRRGRAGANLITIGLLGLLTFAGVGLAAVLADEGERLLREDGFLAFIGALVGLAVTSSVLLVEGAAASLALPTEAASRGPRLVLAGQVLVALVLGGVGLWCFESPKEGATFASVVLSLLLVFAGTFAISERDGAPRAHLDRGGWLKPGAMRSYGLLVVLLVVSTAVWVSILPSLRGGDYGERRAHVLLAAPAYVLLYLSLAVVLGRGTPLKTLGEPLATRIAMVGVTTVGMVVSPILGLIFGGRANDHEWNLFNPLFGMLSFAEHFSGSDGRDVLLALWAFAGMACIGAWVVLKVRDGVRTA